MLIFGHMGYILIFLIVSVLFFLIVIIDLISPLVDYHNLYQII